MSDRLLEAKNAAIKSRSPNLECSQIILTDLSIAGITSVYTENFWVKHRILTFSVSFRRARRMKSGVVKTGHAPMLHPMLR